MVKSSPAPPNPARKEAASNAAAQRVKYRRVHRGRLTGKALRGNQVTYGEYGLVALEPAWIKSNQIEGGPCRHDPLHQAWRPGLDQDLPR